MADPELVEGDQEQFLALVRGQDDRLRDLAYKLLGGDRDRLDRALRDAYRRAYTTLSPRGAGAGADDGTWLYRIVYNACVDELRQAGRQPEPIDLTGTGATVQALGALPVDQRVSVVLVDGEGFDIATAARILGVAPEKIEIRLSRARAALTDGDTPDVVRELAAISVPEHGPDFWSRLSASLQADDAAPTETATTTPPSATPVPDPAPAPPEGTGAISVFDDDPAPAVDEEAEPAAPAARTGRRWAVRVAQVLVTVAVVAIVAIIGLALASDDDSGPDLGSQPGGTTTAPQTAAPEEQAVLAFFDALGRGDTPAAANLLGPRSVAYLTAQSGSVDAFLTDAAEGYGAWGSSPDRQVTVVDGLPVVLVQGTVAQEGSSDYQRLAVPVVHTEAPDAWLVDLWAFDPAIDDQQIDFLAPSATDTGVALTPGAEVQVGVPVAGTVHFSLNGATPTVVPTTPTKGPAGSESNVASWTVPVDAANDATVIVSFAAADGSIDTAVAVPVAIN